MRGIHWHILHEEGALTLCRQTPARFDVSVTVELPMADPLRLAHQVRQDMWRAVQNVRGFSPVVKVTPTRGGVKLTAGGRVAGRVPGNLAAQIAMVLEDEAKRRRWLRHAAPRSSKTATSAQGTGPAQDPAPALADAHAAISMIDTGTKTGS
jgi:hypothetical protein